MSFFTRPVAVPGRNSRANTPPPAGRLLLTGPTTYNVATTGSDVTGDGSVANKWASLQHAYDYITSKLDVGGQNITINVAAGTYGGAAAALSCTGEWSGGGTVTYIGDTTTPANVVLTTSANFLNAVSISCVLPGTLTLKGFKITNTGTGFNLGIAHTGIGTLSLNNLEFGAIPDYHLYCSGSAALVSMTSGSFKVSSGGQYHFLSTAGGYILCNSATYTTANTPAFSGAFAYALRNGSIQCDSSTFTTGTGATGPRYLVQDSGIIITGSGGPNFFPGNSAGSGANFSGGLYS